MRKIFLHAACALTLLATSCSRDKFAELNTDPDLIQVDQVNAASLFPTAPLALHTNDFEAYYDIHRNVQYWIGSWVPLPGNGAIITRFRTPISASNYPYIYEDLYSRETIGVGGAMVEMRNVIDKMDEAKRSKYQHMRAISYIPMALAAFGVSDLLGSIVYSQGFRARYTFPPELTPTYDTQEALYDTLNTQLKNAIAILKQSLPDQEKLNTFDLYYRGAGTEALNWAMAANSLRLRIAMRMLKRKPDAAKAIINEVLADNVGPINSRATSWIFRAGSEVAHGGNYGVAAGISGQKASIDFMYKNHDPRIRDLYQKVALTKAQFDAFQASGDIAPGEVYQEYRGRYISPDAANEADKRFYFNYITGDTAYVSYIQYGMFNSEIVEGSMVNYPVITYADVCFMRAELAARGVTNEAAADWYYKGIEASVADYDDWAKDAQLGDYTPLTAAEVTAYKQAPDIVYDPAKGLEQICVQQFINFYKSPYECWALIKRTGYPSQTGVVLKAEKMRTGGSETVMPRRWALFVPPITDFNYANRRASIEEMQKDPELGGLTDITGRVWWDKK